MLKSAEKIYCGVFDSTILRQNKAKSAERVVSAYELELFHTSGGVSHVDGRAYPVRRGMLLCAKPGQVRYSDFPVRCSFVRLTPGVDADIEGVVCAFFDCFYIEQESRIEELMGLFGKLSMCFVGAACEELNLLRINAVLAEILYRVARLRREETADALPELGRIALAAYEYINEHYAEDCSLKSIADAVHVSPNYLHTVFRQSVGMTPFAYAMKKRIERAKRLIVAGEKSMAEIAAETGFCSQSHFNKVFKEQTNQTPIAYRRTLLEQYW